MKWDIIRIGKYATAIVAIATILITIDSRYQTVEAAESASAAAQAHATRMEIKREKGDLENRLALISHELSYLKNKPSRDGDDEVREEYLRTQLSIVLTRLSELNQ